MKDTKKNNIKVKERDTVRFSYLRPFRKMYAMMPVVFKEPPIEIWIDKTIYMGITKDDDTPFVAELWKDGDDERLTIIMPLLHLNDWDLEVLKKKFQDDLFHSEGYSIDMKCSVAEGITDSEDEESMLMVTAYAEYLVRKGYVHFVNDYEGVCLSYGKDMIGNTVAIITVDMVIDGERYAETEIPVKFPRSMFE